jgi:hypothetical protein
MIEDGWEEGRMEGRRRMDGRTASIEGRKMK